MATTTTNFGWDIPQSTDLVKDGATAIAALGQDIDTAFIDLKGGTTGQVLAKASNTDLDYSWVTTDDTNAIQNAIVDAKGDLIGATAADTPARLAVGTDGQVLTADSTASTGLKWAAGPTPAFVGCQLSKSADQSISNATFTALTFDTEDIDTDGFHSTVSNTSRITIPSGRAGKYFVTVQSRFESSAIGRRIAAVYKNGTLMSTFQFETPPGSSGASTIGNGFYATFSVSDYIEIFTFQSSGGALLALKDGCYFGVKFEGA
jgi:hypothetical protein